MKYLIVLVVFLPFMLRGQCDLDRHNTNESSGWKSCNQAANPNSVRGVSNWIMYDFTFDYLLEDIHLWNHNHPQQLDEGVRNISIDVSSDGVNWTEVIASYNVPQADGSASYSGSLGPTLNARGRYMLLTVNSTYGGSCAALAEIRVGVADEIECLSNVVLPGDLEQKRYYSTDFITSDGNVLNSRTVHFQAQQEVTLNQGFEAKTDSEFLIEIAPCDPD